MNKNIRKMGLSFACGKFLMFLLLGTILFNLISSANSEVIKKVTQIVLIVFTIMIVGLNLNDFFAARKEKYHNIKNQLPRGLRKINHQLIQKFVSNGKSLAFSCFFLGAVVTLGEFLCTGQIYIATIAIVAHSGGALGWLAFLYLVIYSLAFIIPIVILTLLIDKGRQIFEISEMVRKHLPEIKLANALIFVIISIILIFYF